jgi:hypothetical protein
LPFSKTIIDLPPLPTNTTPMSDYNNMVKDNCHMLYRRTYYYYYVKNGGLEVNLGCKNLGNKEATQIAKAFKL